MGLLSIFKKRFKLYNSLTIAFDLNNLSNKSPTKGGSKRFRPNSNLIYGVAVTQQKFENYYNSQIIIMKEQQTKKNCQAFINKLQNCNAYEGIKELLLNWKRQQNKQSVPAAIDTFMKISKIVHGFGQEDKDERLIQFFNRCLVKEAIVPKKNVTNGQVEDAAHENHNAVKIIDNVQEWISKQSKPAERQAVRPAVPPEQIKDNAFPAKLQACSKHTEIAKIIQLYLKSIISFDQVRSLLAPLYGAQPSLVSYIIQSAESVIEKRRKATIFASLNELVDKKYPNLERVGESYILIPEGYANYSKRWKSNVLEPIMNRKCVSVPLGSEVSFIISKKTDYEEQLFNYEDQRYEIDNTLCSLKCMISVLSSNAQSRKMESPLFQKIINEIYPNQNVGNIFIRHPELARNLLLPRILQKRDELTACREKFIKVCEDVAAKNFYKSLDYRCFYFAKNDKKFNCPARWEKEIEMRKVQILENKDSVEEQQIEDRESLQRGRFFYVNSFDNITKQNFIENRQVKASFDRKFHSVYPKYPDNQTLFILNFANDEVLNDVFQVLLYYCNRKNLLELLVFKLMRTDIKKKLKKSPLFNHLIETRQKIANNQEIADILANASDPSLSKALEQQGYPMGEDVFLNETKGLCKNFKDSEEQFMQMIEEDEEPVQIEDQASPFEGPQRGFTLLGTKPMYTFLRYVTAIYQRFLKAKQYSDQAQASFSLSQDSPDGVKKLDIYKFFLTVIYKIKERKYFEEHLRKIFCKNAFIFFTLQKMILSAVKVISNIGADSLTFHIIKDQTKDYELGAFDWEKFAFPSVTMQLARLYLQEQALFRFTYEPGDKNFFISVWNPLFKNNRKEQEQFQEYQRKLEQYMTKPARSQREKAKTKKQASEYVENAEEIATCLGGRFILRGEIVLAKKDIRQTQDNLEYAKIELAKLRRARRKYL